MFDYTRKSLWDTECWLAGFVTRYRSRTRVEGYGVVLHNSSQCDLESIALALEDRADRECVDLEVSALKWLMAERARLLASHNHPTL